MMPMPLIPKPLYPLVPQAAGVPNLLRSGAQIIDGATFGLLGVTNALDSLLGISAEQWGIFGDDGKAVILADTVLGIQYRNEYRIADHPVESGSFASYNKVANPYDVRIRMMKGGNEADRYKFIARLEWLTRGTDLYSVLTPERTFESANIYGFDYERTVSAGAYVIIADLDIREIRETAIAQYYNTQQPDGAPQQSTGQVQATAAPAPAVQKVDAVKSSGASGSW